MEGLGVYGEGLEAWGGLAMRSAGQEVNQIYAVGWGSRDALEKEMLGEGRKEGDHDTLTLHFHWPV